MINFPFYLLYLFLFYSLLYCFISILHIHSTGGSDIRYTQTWLRGEGPIAHIHEGENLPKTSTFLFMRTIYKLGIKLADNSGWVAIGETLPNEGQSRRSRVKEIVSKL